MGLTEVLLVEACIYKDSVTKIVLPRVFGYSEQARAIRRATNMAGARGPIATDWNSFAANARKKGLDEDSIARCSMLYDACVDLKADIAWGRGVETASFSPKWKSLRASVALLGLYATGGLELRLDSLQSSEPAAAFRDRFAKLLENVIQLRQGYSQYPRSEWMPKAEEVIAALRNTLEQPVTHPVPAAR